MLVRVVEPFSEQVNIAEGDRCDWDKSKDLCECAVRVVVAPWITLHVAPSANRSDEVNDFDRERHIVVYSGVFRDGFEVIQWRPVGDANSVLLFSSYWCWVGCGCKESSFMERIKEVRVVVALKKKLESLPCELVIRFHHVDKGLLFCGEPAHVRGSISRARSSSTSACCSTRGADAGIRCAKSSKTSSNWSRSLWSRRNGMSWMPHSCK